MSLCSATPTLKVMARVKKKVQRDFEKPSFEEKTRFLALVLDMSEGNMSCPFIY